MSELLLSSSDFLSLSFSPCRSFSGIFPSLSVVITKQTFGLWGFYTQSFKHSFVIPIIKKKSFLDHQSLPKHEPISLLVFLALFPENRTHLLFLQTLQWQPLSHLDFRGIRVRKEHTTISTKVSYYSNQMPPSCLNQYLLWRVRWAIKVFCLLQLSFSPSCLNMYLAGFWQLDLVPHFISLWALSVMGEFESSKVMLCMPTLVDYKWVQDRLVDRESEGLLSIAVAPVLMEWESVDTDIVSGSWSILSDCSGLYH